MKRKSTIIKITKYDKDPQRVGDELEIETYIIGSVKPKKKVKQNKNTTKKPRMTVDKLANILMDFIVRQEQFNVRQEQFNAKMERVIILNNLKTE
ncbi:MAG: hypothetical protein LBQ45_01225 [Mycoplasmataceae bacterium]|jgi:hypothetical protein|nr:hypothetical protein [Mycoplasmataceae bacterium]